MASAWESGRPIYNRLPIESGQYQGNVAVDAMTGWIDALLVAVKVSVINFERDFTDPVTARVDALDWLAQYHGFTGEYWEPQWSTAIKRQLITDGQTYIFPSRGLTELLEYFFDLFGIDGRLYLVGSFLAGINVAGDPCGGDPLYYYILLPLVNGYMRTSYEWNLVVKLNRLYMPCAVRSLVCYQQFYAGFSVAGDPVFLNVG